MKNRLFELIREEKIILFAGAGTSLGAGYPNGYSLRDILFNNLKSSEKKIIDASLPLINFTEEFCKIKDDDRKTLNTILLNQFQFKKPTSLKWHKDLSLIPHIKTIITTNYDCLFEKGYEGKATLLFNSSHISKNIKKQTEIYKVHGDLSDLNSIIITNSDYNKFFKYNSENSIFWSAIKTKMASNSILFIGYNLEDPNINVIFEKIFEELGSENQKEHFLLAPNLPEHKIKHLNKKGIHYLNMKSDNFLEELKRHLEENVIEDFRSQKIREETFIDFSRNYGMMPKFKISKDRYEFMDFEAINQPINRSIKICLADDWNLENEFSKYIASNSFDNFEIPKDKILNSQITYGDLLFKKNGLEKFQFSPVPDIETTVDIDFESGAELADIQIKFYKRGDYAEIKAKLKLSTAVMKFDFSKGKREFKFEYSHKEVCGRLKDEIDEMAVFMSLAKGDKITIYPKGYKIIQDKLPANKEFADHAEFCLNFFKKLKIIENIYNIKFENIPFNSIDPKKSLLLDVIIDAKNGKSIEKYWDGELKMFLTEDAKTSKEIRQLYIDNAYSAVYPSPKEDVIDLYNHKLNLGFRFTQLVDSYIENPLQLINGESEVAIFKSKANKILIRWTKDQINNSNINNKL